VGLKETGYNCVYWVRVAQVIVNTVMDLKAPYKAGEILGQLRNY